MDDVDRLAEGQSGPGLQATPGIDKTLVTAAIAVAIGFTHWTWWRALIGFGYFGPIEVPAIIAMVGVLFAFIALLRAVDLKDAKQRTWAIAIGVAGLLRLFLLPWF